MNVYNVIKFNLMTLYSFIFNNSKCIRQAYDHVNMGYISIYL